MIKLKSYLMQEGFLDDILADFEPVSQAEINKVMKKSDAVLAKYAKPKSPYKSYKPRKYSYIKSFQG